MSEDGDQSAKSATIGEWSEGAAVLFLFALAQLLETRSMERVRHAIRALMQLAPAKALVRRGGAEILVGVDDLVLEAVQAALGGVEADGEKTGRSQNRNARDCFHR